MLFYLFFYLFLFLFYFIYLFFIFIYLFIYFFFFESSVLWAGGGEKARRSGKNTIRIKGQNSKQISLKSGQKPDTEQVQRPTGGTQ